MRLVRNAAIAATVAVGLAGTFPAAASTLSATWTTLLPGHPDANLSITGVVTGLVENTLGPNGLPVRSAFSASFGAGDSRRINDIDPITNEILWWTPRSGVVAPDPFYPNPVSIPFNVSSNLFPGGAANNGGNVGWTAAHFFGTFTLPTAGTITVSLGSDDDAWVFVNGALLVDNGGVHGLATAPTTSGVLNAGVNRIDMFFADRHDVQSGLVFFADITFQPIEVAEPGTLALLGAGLIAMVAARRRR